jgi:hypothetical protein
MKAFAPITAVVVCLVCSSCEDGPRKIGVAWPPGYAYVPRCKPLVKYQGTGIEIQGVKIPVPQLGGAAEVGGVKIEPKVLNQAYQTTQILDQSYHADCGLLPAFTTDKEKFERAVQRMQDSQTKLQQLAMSLQGLQQGGTAPAPAPVASVPEKRTPAANELQPIVAGSSSAGNPEAGTASAPDGAKKAAAKKRLTKWVDSYAKKSKAAVVNTPAKANSTLGLPAASPAPHP